MSNEELNLQKVSYNLNERVQFRSELYEMYNNLSYKISRKKGRLARCDLYNIIEYIYDHIEFIGSLPK